MRIQLIIVAASAFLLHLEAKAVSACIERFAEPSPSDVVICSDPELVDLNESLDAVRGHLGRTISSEERRSLMADQTRWSRGFEDRCGLSSLMLEGAQFSQQTIGCIRDELLARTLELGQRLERATGMPNGYVQQVQQEIRTREESRRRNDHARRKEPQFSDYPALERPKGRARAIDFGSHDWGEVLKRYSAEYNAELRQGPNFAGAYRLVTFSCGAPCTSIVAIDVSTGKIVGTTGSVSSEMRFNLSSRLLIIDAWSFYKIPTTYWVFENGRFQELKYDGQPARPDSERTDEKSDEQRRAAEERKVREETERRAAEAKREAETTARRAELIQKGEQKARESGVKWTLDESRDTLSRDTVLTASAQYENDVGIAIQITFRCQLSRPKQFYVTALGYSNKDQSGIPYRADTHFLQLRFRVDEDQVRSGTVIRYEFSNRALINRLIMPTNPPDYRMGAGGEPSGRYWLQHYEIAVEFPLQNGDVTALINPYADNLRKVLEACGA